MYIVDTYVRVRRAYYREGKSIRQIARLFGIHRQTIRKMLEYSVPPGYRRKSPPQRPKLAPYIGIIDQILETDQSVPKKQRHTAKRIFERLRDEHGFPGQYTIVKDYVREKRRRSREMFVPLVHPPGYAQADFGEALVDIGGIRLKAHFFVMDLPYCDAYFVKAYPGETTEAFCDAHNSAFAFFGGVPQEILYDNTKIAVARILGDGKRKLTRIFSELLSHYLFDYRFGRVGKGNDKGKVENLVGYVRRNHMVPIPSFESFDALNAYLEEQCRARLEVSLKNRTETVGEMLEQERQTFLPLPQTTYDASDKQSCGVNSLSLVRYKNNDYSVPVEYGYREVLVRGYVHEVVISCAEKVIARHPRSYDKGDLVFNPLHYLSLIERKIGALDQAAPLAEWKLPEQFDTLHRLLESRMGKKGKREYVQVLRLIETFSEDDVAGAVKDALRLGTIGFDAVKHLLLCRIERRPPRLDLEEYPYLPRARVDTTSASEYMSLLMGGRS